MSNLTLPIRGAFYYPWFTVSGSAPYKGAWTQGTNPWTQFHPKRGYYDSSDTTTIDAHIGDMLYGKFQVGIASWWGQASKENGVFPTLLSRAQTLGTGFQWCIYYEAEGNTIAGVTGSPSPTTAQITADLNYLTTNYTSHPNYLHVGGKPVIFVYGGPEDDPAVTTDITQRTCARWNAANAAATESWYINLKVYSGYATDAATYPIDSFHQYAPANAVDTQSTYSRTLSPRFQRGDNALPYLAPVSRTTWQTNIRNMVAGSQDWKLVTSFNEWGEGHAVECCDRPSVFDSGTNTNRVYTGIGWDSVSGYGWVLDDLHNDGVDMRVQRILRKG